MTATATETVVLHTIPNRGLTAQERKIICSGLRMYAVRMEQRAKQLSEDDCPNALQLALVKQIRGDEHGSGLIGVFT